MVAGTAMAAGSSFDTPVYELNILGVRLAAYEALYALALNLAVAAAVTALARALGRRDDADETSSEDYGV